jgi:hypothetical protein
MHIQPSGQRKKNNFVSGNSQPRSSQSYSPRVPHWWAGENKGLKSVVICPRCQAIYYDKHWHSWESANRRLPKDLPSSVALCRACATLAVKTGNPGRGYEGETTLSGLDDLPRRLLVVNLIKNIGARALRRDPEDQIIMIEEKKDAVRVTTTKNQLAISIGKQVDAALKGGKLKVIWSREDAPARVRWIAPAK